MFVGQIFENGLFCIRKIMQDGCYKGVEVIMISLNLRKNNKKSYYYWSYCIYLFMDYAVCLYGQQYETRYKS